ncbi:hypothetical protein RvY_18718 [Ramazzottius varieornatus]|uniref:Transposase Tc1-like domain-containing protein n=1 Tax=Ramazzottius varieornatus TaxID=947166 RepID=A0A1D1WAX3_RAMVA|nr:hypothetical protein RvY_18718 [Ramazzottius varieornatus]
MAPGKVHHPEIVKAVYRMRAQKKTHEEIAKTFGHNRAWAFSIFKKYDEETGLPKKPREFPRKTDKSQDDAILDWVKEHGQRNFRKMASDLKEAGLADISEHTIRRRLKELIPKPKIVRKKKETVTVKSKAARGKFVVLRANDIAKLPDPSTASTESSPAPAEKES